MIGVGAVVEDITEHRAPSTGQPSGGQRSGSRSCCRFPQLDRDRGVGEIAGHLVEHLIREVVDYCPVWLYVSERSHFQAAAFGHRDPNAAWLRKAIADLTPVADNGLLPETIHQQQMLVIDDIEAEPYLRAVNPQFAAFVKGSRLQALCVGAAGSRQRGIGRCGRRA
ncbi:MAG: hypothetical protein ACXVHI_01235 [Frankiaceae bacterium]